MSVLNKDSNVFRVKDFIFLPVGIVVIQTLWLLPALDDRVSLIISGEEAPKSKLHLCYVLLEIVKVISLFIYGIKSIRRLKKG